MRGVFNFLFRLFNCHFRLFNCDFRLPRNEVDELCPLFLAGTFSFRRRDPAKDDDGNEEEGGGEDERPEVGENGESAWRVGDYHSNYNGKEGHKDEVEFEVQEVFFDVHGEKEGEIEKEF